MWNALPVVIQILIKITIILLPLLQRWSIRQLAGRPEGFTDGHKLIPGRPYPPVQKNGHP